MSEKKVIKIAENFNSEDIRQVSTLLADSMKPLIEACEKFASIEIHKSLEQMQKVFEEVRKQYEELPDYLTFFSKHGWIVYGQLTYWDIERIVKHFKDSNYNFEEEERLLSEYYIKCIPKKKRLNIIENLITNSLLVERNNILKEVKLSCEKDMYFVGSVTLITLIEGIIISKMDAKTRICQKNIKNYLNSLTENSVINHASLLYIIQNKFYENFNLGNSTPIPNDICRHAILHGVDTNYGTEIVFLKLLLILDTTSQVLSNMKYVEEVEPCAISLS